MPKAKLSNQTRVRLKQAQADADQAVEEVTKILTGHTEKPRELAEGVIHAKPLQSFIDRIERLNEEKSALTDDIKEVFAEAKGVGFDVKTMRRIIRLRGMDEQKRREAQELLNTYAAAIGLQYPLL